MKPQHIPVERFQLILGGWLLIPMPHLLFPTKLTDLDTGTHDVSQFAYPQQRYPRLGASTTSGFG